jgi:hypothetical protein
MRKEIEAAASGQVYEIVMRDPFLLSGVSVARLTSALARIVQAKFVYVSDLIGGPARLNENAEEVITLDFFDQWVSVTAQYDWAFFYFLKRKPDTDFPDDQSEKDWIRIADLTVRLVDSEYFYIYTRDSASVDYLLGQYVGCEVRTVDIDTLDIPY